MHTHMHEEYTCTGSLTVFRSHSTHTQTPKEAVLIMMSSSSFQVIKLLIRDKDFNGIQMSWCVHACKCVAKFLVCVCVVYLCIERAENTVKLPPPSPCLHCLYSIISILTGNAHTQTHTNKHTITHSAHRGV